MALDRVFSTPTVTVDQDKYDNLVILSEKYKKFENKCIKLESEEK